MKFLVLLLLSGCAATAPVPDRPSRATYFFRGALGISPGIQYVGLQWGKSGNGIVWLGHSAGGNRIRQLFESFRAWMAAPQTVVLVEPWPLHLDLSNSPSSVRRIVVISARPCTVIPPPGVDIEYRSRPPAMLPIDLTWGHLVACGWAEALP